MPLENILKKALSCIVRAIAQEITKPINELNDKVERIEERISKLHEPDEVARECDLSIMDDRICYLIEKCREKGYTTANDRRVVGRMHEAYKARGGNHGEENEYAVFLRLPTEEEHNRMNA